MAGVSIEHVPYKGSTPAYIDLMAGQVSMYFAVAASGMPYVKSGKLRAMGVTAAKRAPQMSDVPTIAEAGLPGYDIASFYALVVPAATPRALVTRLSAAITQAVTMPALRDRLLNAGSEPASSTPEELLQFVKDNAAKYDKIIRNANIKAE